MKYGRKFAIAMYFGTLMTLVATLAMLLHAAQPDALFGALGVLGSAAVGASAWEDGKKVNAAPGVA
jgi:hypothetical protein